jgi:hypothetical protein
MRLPRRVGAEIGRYSPVDGISFRLPWHPTIPPRPQRRGFVTVVSVIQGLCVKSSRETRSRPPGKAQRTDHRQSRSRCGRSRR